MLIVFSVFPRKDCIFTIDPSTARDLDDALSCRPLTDGRMEISLPFCAVGSLHPWVMNTMSTFHVFLRQLSGQGWVCFIPELDYTS